MKIIKDGRIIDVWIGKCEECGAVMEAKKEELKWRRKTDDVAYHEEYIHPGNYFSIGFYPM